MIIANDEEALRVVCEDVLPEEVGPLRERLEEELRNSTRLGRPGVGLAAPQIGIAKKFAIVRLDKNGHYDLELDLVNAQIKNAYHPQMFRNEGCLSFPGRVEDTMRYQEVHIVNNLVGPKKFIATGLLSVICQHELDHINQVLFIDHAIKKTVNIGVNSPCICGSGKKYKKCCQKTK